MARLNITVCDKCRSMDKSTTTYTIEGNGTLATLDLCEDDAKVLIEYQEMAPIPEVSPLNVPTVSARKASRSNARIITMEELEKLKAAGKA